jgi:hypothetical protein
LRKVICKLGTHIVQQHVGVRVDSLISQLREAMRRTGG